MEVEGRCDSKRICTRELGGNRTALNPDLCGGYTNVHVLTFIDLYNFPLTSSIMYNLKFLKIE